METGECIGNTSNMERKEESLEGEMEKGGVLMADLPPKDKSIRRRTRYETSLRKKQVLSKISRKLPFLLDRIVRSAWLSFTC